MTNSEDPEQSDQGLHCFVSLICPNTVKPVLRYHPREGKQVAA